MSKINNFVKRAIAFFLRRWYRILPAKNYILMESLNDFDCNTGALYDYMLEQGYEEKYTFLWFVQEREKYQNNKHTKHLDINHIKFREYKYLYRAKYAIWDNKPIEKFRKEQINVYLTHGTPCLKDVRGIINIPDHVDYILAPSVFTKEIEKKQFNAYDKNYMICGHPRNDLLFKPSKEAEKIIGQQKEYHKLFLWMPTFRKANFSKERNDSTAEYPFGIPLFRSQEDMEKVNTLLQSLQSILLIKMHPGQDLSVISMKSLSHIVLLTAKELEEKNVNLYRLIGQADALISDYSSVVFDYLLLNRPMAFVVDDIKEYKIGFITENPYEFMCGEKIKTLEEFLSFLEKTEAGKDDYLEERKRVGEKINQYQDGKDRKRLIEFLKI